jgi:ERF superfamily
MEKLNLYQRISKVMKEVTRVVKEDKKVNNQYRFVSHDAVTAALHGPCVDAGLVIMPSVIDELQEGNTTKVVVELAFINADNPTERHVVRSFGYGCDGQDKGPGKGYSYAVKMALLKAFMLESGEEDIELSSIDRTKKEETRLDPEVPELEKRKSSFRRSS